MTRQEYKEQEKKTPEKEYKRKVLKRDKNGIEIRTDGVVSAPEKDREKFEKLDQNKELERHRNKHVSSSVS